jgi:two-component system chemotaxis sensor kinase CheA
MSDYLDPNNEELLKDFFVEAQLQVESLESNILVLENEPTNHDAIDEIFRAAHTLKGASATVQMMELSEFTHLVEDVLDRVRSNELHVTEDIIDLFLTSIDIVKEMLSARQNGTVFDQDISETQGRLRRLLQTAEATPAETEPKASTAAARSGSGTTSEAGTGSSSGAPGAELSEYDALELREAAEGKPVYRVRVNFNEDNPMNTVGGIQVFASLKRHGTVLKTDPEFEKLYEDAFFPVVDYFLATEEDTESLADAIKIPDVTLDIEVEAIDGSAKAEAQTPTSSVTQPDEPEQPGETGEGVAAEEAPGGEEAAPASAAEQAKQEALARAGAAGEEKAPAQQSQRGTQMSSVLRVDSARIDNLLNLVSETVINKATFNQISTAFAESLTSFQAADARHRELLKDLFDSLPDYLQQIENGKSVSAVKKEILNRFGEVYNTFDTFYGEFKSTVGKFRSTAQNLGRITGELQEGVMRIRMVPISQIFSRFPRLVRDLSKSLQKQVYLDIQGEDTELDKSVIEDLLDPLIHAVRNSIDHGIESPAERRKAGKPEQGTLSLRASNEGNMIIIEIEDDGKGIDVQGIQRKAVERGVIHRNKTLSDVEAFNLIFDPGFSTAAKITNVSGRGVGLDVVKRQIERLNGSVTVWSELGVGTRFTVKIPLTLAIIQGLLVRVGPEMYAIPITSVLDSHRIKPSDIKLIDNYEVFNVRDDVVSLLRLNRLFGIETKEDREYLFVVIVGSGDKKMGLVVDSLIGEEDVVIKPLRDHYTNAPGIAGANITGDGTVSLIIDVGQLLELGLKHEAEQRRRRETTIG